MVLLSLCFSDHNVNQMSYFRWSQSHCCMILPSFRAGHPIAGLHPQLVGKVSRHTQSNIAGGNPLEMEDFQMEIYVNRGLSISSTYIFDCRMVHPGDFLLKDPDFRSGCAGKGPRLTSWPRYPADYQNRKWMFIPRHIQRNFEWFGEILVYPLCSWNKHQ